MEDKRAKTWAKLKSGIRVPWLTVKYSMEALSTFIESQKALVARTQADIAKLKSLRDDIAAMPDDLSSLATFEDKVCTAWVVNVRFTC